MSEIDEIYSNIIMEHGMNSYNKHELVIENCSLHGHNPNCGDDLTLHIDFKDDKIQDISFTGVGCAISQSSTSVMTDVLRGKTIKDAKQIVEIFIKMIDRQNLTNEEKRLLSDAIAFENISNMPARVKCALLSWKTLKQKLDEMC